MTTPIHSLENDAYDSAAIREEISEALRHVTKPVKRPPTKGTKPPKAKGKPKARRSAKTVPSPVPDPTNLASALTCIDLFAGCGGLSLGLEQAGFRPLLFSEINTDAANTYMVNRKEKDFFPIGDIYQLTDTNLRHLQNYWAYKGIVDVDLVCGGPPCQGYSGIGHRRTFTKLERKDIPSNHLFQEMVRVIRAIRPKCFLFENVRGLLHSRWTKYGTKGEIFAAVREEFASLSEYRITWDLLYSKDYGVPQNRPRVVMIGVRSDVLPQSLIYQGGRDSTPREGAVAAGFLPKPSGRPPTLPELLGDLEDPLYRPGDATRVYLREPSNEAQRMLRTRPDGTLMLRGEELTEQEYSEHSERIQLKFTHMIRNNGEIPEDLRTKKFAQRVFPTAWDKNGPNITITSLPEDYVHYSQPRAPTVREWARIQTFPDWYQFEGPRTTGGRRRAGDPDKNIWERDVPRFTQIGNAVPVLLARKIGEHLRTILDESGQSNDEPNRTT